MPGAGSNPVTQILFTGCSSEAECLVWNREDGISEFPTLTKKCVGGGMATQQIANLVHAGSSPVPHSKVFGNVAQLVEQWSHTPFVGSSILPITTKFKEEWQSQVYCTGLENRRTERFREFESHLFRQIYAPIAQLAEATDSNPVQCRFDSYSVYQKMKKVVDIHYKRQYYINMF